MEFDFIIMIQLNGLIRMLAFFGLTYKLHEFPENEVQKGILQMQQKKLNTVSDQIDWAPEIQELPELTMEQVKKSCEAEEKTCCYWKCCS